MTLRAEICLLLVALVLGGSKCSTRYFVKMRTNASELFKTRAESLRVMQNPIAATPSPPQDVSKGEDEKRIKNPTALHLNKRNSFVETSTFNPDVLNKFLEEYANKIKSSTDKNLRYPLRVVKPTTEPLLLEIDQTTYPTTISHGDTKLEEDTSNSTVNEDTLGDTLNDTLKRNKWNYGANAYEDRNGWVTLEAIPWSKSKISKWQANPSTQRPWPEIKPWEKPSNAKPWTSDYSIRPIYDNSKPWYEKPKPNWPETNDKPWQKPVTRPSYYPDKQEESVNQAQKWPPERPSWNKYTDSHRPNSDIITDDRPSNFPTTWNRPPSVKPPYQFLDQYSEKNQDESSNWHDFPSRYEQSNDRLRPLTERPNFSHYQYVNNHPPTYPANGDGQWVLLSTNRGYSKSRQRSIKIDEVGAENETRIAHKKEEEPPVPMMTSKRQVRLTVLPSVNGTNTTTSHGGLLEVEKTFKTVDQSRKEYEMERQTTETSILKRRPMRNTLLGQPSSSAVLAAIGAGMLPATMAMMIPMILGRRKRDLFVTDRSISINPVADLQSLEYIKKTYSGSRRRKT